MIYFMPFRDVSVFNLPRMGQVSVMKFHSFHPYVVMREYGQTFPSNSPKHKPAARKNEVIIQDAAPEQQRHPPEWSPETQIIVRPEMIEWDKDI
jgi:hypothetical protein